MKIRNRFTGEVILEVPGDTLTDATLTGADLTGADLTDATLTGAFVMLEGRKFFLTEEPKQ